MSEPNPEPQPNPARARWLLAALVLLVALAALVLAIAGGRADSALLFVGLPTLLAVAVALTPAASAHAMVLKGTTLALLLTAVFLHEGAVCVLLAAPVVYAVAHGVTALIQWERRRPHYGWLLVPVILASSFEGVVPGLRAVPEQTVTVTRQVALTPAQVGGRVAAGPGFGATRQALLTGVPLPQTAVAAGPAGPLAPGTRWTFRYAGSSHGPGGQTVMAVQNHTASPAGTLIRFRPVEDSSITARWLYWRAASLQWRPAGQDRTEVSAVLTFTRRLDPSWYFGPVQQLMVGAGAEHLLDSLVGTEPLTPTAGGHH